MPDRPAKAPNPFLKRVRHLSEIPGPTNDEVGEFLWGHKDGPLAAQKEREKQQPPPQGGQYGR